MFIPILEQTGHHLMFLRPRRFGKSLWCSIPEAYYDTYYQPEFEQIFKGTWIYDNRTITNSMKNKTLQQVVLIFYGWELIKCIAV